METRPRLLDLCSGIGGFALAASWLGIETIGFCEIDNFCQRVLAKNFPGVPIHDDLKTLTGTVVRGWLRRGFPLALADTTGCEGGAQCEGISKQREPRGFRAGDREGLDLITAGYPCQPFSHAGKRLGTEDDRHLWPHIVRLVAELRPRYCLFENVAGHISLGLDDVLSDLEALGYTCRAVVVPACAVNAPHRRDRVWIVADAESAGGQPLAGSVAGSTTAPLRESEGSWHFGWSGQREGQPSSRCEDVADTADGRLRRGEPSGQPGFASCGGEVAADAALISQREQTDETDTFAGSRNSRFEPSGGSWGEALSGLGDAPDGLPRRLAGPLNAWSGDWEAGVSRTADKEPDRVNKLKALGNAIVPQVAYVILSSMLAAA